MPKNPKKRIDTINKLITPSEISLMDTILDVELDVEYLDGKVKRIDKTVENLIGAVEDVQKTPGPAGKDGKDGVSAKPLNEEKIISRVVSKVSNMIQVPSVDIEAIIDEIKSDLPKPGKNIQLDTPMQLANKLNTLENEIDFKVLKNVPKFGKALAKDGYPYGLPQPAASLTYQLGGAQVGRGNILNLVAGTNVTIDAVPNGDKMTYTINATGGGGGTPAAPDTSIQFNDGGAFGGDVDWTFTDNADPGQKVVTLRGNRYFIPNTTSIAFGNNAGPLGNSAALRGMFFGANAGVNITGNDNTLFGYFAGAALGTAVGNSFFGSSAGANNSANLGTFMGYQAGLQNNTGQENCFFGALAGTNNTMGNSNCFYGSSAGGLNTSGARDSYYGQQAGYMASGNDNAYYGNQSGAGIVNPNSGSQNSFYGSESGEANTTGANNCYYGFKSGETNTTASRNSFFGVLTASSGATIGDSIAIGYGATVTAANQMVVGSTTVATTNVYIGNGVTNATPQGFTLEGTGKSGANGTGGPVTIAGGAGSGNVLGGSVFINTYIVQASGSGTQLFQQTNVEFNPNKASLFFGRVEENVGSDTAAANDLTLAYNGNFFTITGNTTINAITVADWQAGSQIVLLFTGTPTVKHNTAGGAGTASLFLAGSVDLTAANNTILGLRYDGVQWQEEFRKVA